MTAKSDFTEEEWKLVSEGPVTAGMIVLTAQQPGADQIDREAEAGHRNRLAIDDRDW